MGVCQREYDTAELNHEIFLFGTRTSPNDYFPHKLLEKITEATKSDREIAKKNADFVAGMLDRYISNKTKQQQNITTLWKDTTTT